MNTNDVTAVLNDLIETCREGQEGFGIAAESIHTSEFRRLFNILSQQRAQFVSELQAEVYRLGGDLRKTGGETGWFQRGWTNFEAAVARGDESSIIADCQPGEEAAVRNYEEALKMDLPLDVQYVVKRQYMDIKDAFDRIRILQRAA